ncbi:hypothetical protein RCN09_01425, partial [Escherichia marmotae]|nr:hypothetical protein [Escherichia marmotae]
MLRKISVKRNVQLKGKSYIKKTDVRPYDRQEHIYKQTMDYVNKIVREANKNVDEIKNKAFVSGYFNGLKLCITTLIKFITASSEKSESFSQACYERLEMSLKNALQDPNIIGLLFNQWKEQQKNHDETIQLFLPALMKKAESHILSSLSPNLREKIIINYHKTSKCIIKYGDQMAEFAPDEIISIHMATLDDMCTKYVNEMKDILRENINEIISEIN